ncbi:MAG: FHA domain-containing protein [Myxococcota bacterium]|nr:FHA domain-containing protein [Myxococcota bacterium]
MTDEPSSIVAPSEDEGTGNDEVICRECGASVPAHHRFCGLCGASLSAAPVGGEQWLLSLLDPDGAIESTAALVPGTQVVGSAPNADIQIDGDRAVSPQHVLVRLRDGELSLEDKSTRNGLFKPLTDHQPIGHNALIRAGGQLFRFQLIDRLGVEPVVPLPHPSFGPSLRSWGRLLRYNRHGQVASSRLLDQPCFRIGRREGDWRLPRARTMSGLHFELSCDEAGETTIHDLDSRNGTFVEVRGAAQVQHEDRFLIGDRLVLAQQVSLEAYHDALGGSSAEAIEEAEVVDESEIRAEDTLVAIPHEFTDTGHAQGAQEELSPGLLDEEDAPPASGELEQLPASVQAVAEDAPSPAAEAADAHPVDGDHAPADEDLITQIDEDPGEWARAALSDFQDLDD